MEGVQAEVTAPLKDAAEMAVIGDLPAPAEEVTRIRTPARGTIPYR